MAVLGVQRLKLDCDDPLSYVAFNSNLCRHTLVTYPGNIFSTLVAAVTAAGEAKRVLPMQAYTPYTPLIRNTPQDLPNTSISP